MPSFFKIFPIFLLLGAVSHANDRCPLSNPAYKDVRVAVTKLQEKLTLPQGCEKIEEELKSVGAGIKSAVDSIYEKDAELKKNSETPLNDSEKKEAELAKLKLKLAVDGLQNLSSAMARHSSSGKNGCGKAISSNLDFLEAFADTVNSLAPFFLVYGGKGSALMVLKATVLSAMGKSLITIYKDKGPDMSDPKQRQIFVENACAFYSFNEGVEALQNRDEQIRSSEQTIEKLQASIAELERQGKPPVALGFEAIGEAETFLQSSNAQLKSYAEVSEKLGGPDKNSFACRYVRSRIETGVADRAVTHLRYLLSFPSADTSADEQLLVFFAAESSPQAIRKASSSPKLCGDRARYWIELFKTVLGRIDGQLARPGRRDKAMVAISEWEKAKLARASELKAERERLAWLRTLNEAGEMPEVSEILQIRDDSRDALFISSTRRAIFNLIPFHRQSLSAAWLGQKNSSALRKLEEYSAARETAIPQWMGSNPDPVASKFVMSPSYADGCAEMKALLLTWLTAQAHVEAAKVFCSTFRYVYSESLHPETVEYCYGKRERGSTQRAEAINLATEREVLKHSEEAARIAEWLRAATCPLPKRMELPKS